MDFGRHFKAARRAALKAGRMLRENMDVTREVSFKGVVDVVTNFDKRSQRMIIDDLSRRFPGHDFLAEEGLDRDKGSDFRWLIDPIDGTTNFVHRFPFFCVSVALEYGDEIVLGVVFDPIAGELFTAVKGRGAFLNRRTIRVSAVDNLDSSLISTGFPYDVRESRDNNIDHFTHFLTRVQAVRRCGSAALDLCYVACGRFDGFWEMKLNPWDVAAAALILTEAGGRLTDFQGGKHSVYGRETLGSNGLIHNEMLEVLQLAVTTRAAGNNGPGQACGGSS